jgi:hypothetical protein
LIGSVSFILSSCAQNMPNTHSSHQSEDQTPLFRTAVKILDQNYSDSTVHSLDQLKDRGIITTSDFFILREHGVVRYEIEDIQASPPYKVLRLLGPQNECVFSLNTGTIINHM